MTTTLPDATDAAALIEMMYGPLTDRTHPSFGAFTPGTAFNADGLPEHVLRPPFDADNIDELLSATLMALLIAGEALDEVMKAAADTAMVLPAGEPHWQEGDLHVRDDEDTKASTD